MPVPAMEGACISEVGVLFRSADACPGALCAWMDDFDISGSPDYTIDFAKEHMDMWNGLHTEVSQFTRLKGLWYLKENALNGSCSDFGEAYTGDVNFRDYTFTATLRPQLGQWHGINVLCSGIGGRRYAEIYEKRKRIPHSLRNRFSMEMRQSLPFIHTGCWKQIRNIRR